ncbi:hypothetical protein [Micromonospora sp. IBHARD004]|uniref:hypothetical protein n=1 Tax=Micromonospora sp. IBHARD004 TaxID=3457764 RepID=UPI0040598C72
MAVRQLTVDRFLARRAGLPSADEAAAQVVPAYLGAYGLAGPETFDQWLSRGASRRAVPRGSTPRWRGCGRT